VLDSGRVQVEVVSTVLAITLAGGFPNEVTQAEEKVEISFRLPRQEGKREQYRILRVGDRDGKLVWLQTAPTVIRGHGTSAAIQVHETGVYALAKVALDR